MITLVTLRQDDMPQLLGLAALILVLDLLAMLSADRILKTPFAASFLGIVGSVLAALQVALGVQAAVGGLQLLGVV